MQWTEERKPLEAWLWGLASVPAVWLIAFGLFVLRARLSLGRWPAPYQPDPKDLGFDFHYTAVVAGMPLMLAAVLARDGAHADAPSPICPPMVDSCCRDWPRWPARSCLPAPIQAASLRGLATSAFQ